MRYLDEVRAIPRPPAPERSFAIPQLGAHNVSLQELIASLGAIIWAQVQMRWAGGLG
jgi:hypothetical protein